MLVPEVSYFFRDYANIILTGCTCLPENQSGFSFGCFQWFNTGGVKPAVYELSPVEFRLFGVVR